MTTPHCHVAALRFAPKINFLSKIPVKFPPPAASSTCVFLPQHHSLSPSQAANMENDKGEIVDL
jgi:hypothetical protein